jgi:hypothetical protein
MLHFILPEARFLSEDFLVTKRHHFSAYGGTKQCAIRFVLSLKK